MKSSIDTVGHFINHYHLWSIRKKQNLLKKDTYERHDYILGLDDKDSFLKTLFLIVL